MKHVSWMMGGASLLAIAAGAGAYESGEVKDGGTIVGVVEFEGTAPAPKKIPVTKDQQVCGKEKEAEELIVNDGKIENAVVSIADIKSGKELEPTTVTLDQKGCHYI
ncbi:MAG: hypothetical protein ACREQY_13920, partial [Candidatus Binatia bacterium]